jgi:hypothetical protein
MEMEFISFIKMHVYKMCMGRGCLSLAGDSTKVQIETIFTGNESNRDGGLLVPI